MKKTVSIGLIAVFSFVCFSEGTFAYPSYAKKPSSESESEATSNESDEYRDELLESQSQIERYRKKKGKKKKKKRKRRRPRKRKKAGQAVNLSELNETKYSTKQDYGSGAFTGQPHFKMLFDLLLQYRPGVAPLTFSSSHTLLLLEYAPTPTLSFGFEVAPTPRYYELAYQATKKVQFRFGRIWIPFDDMNPHNQFGGWINNSDLRQPNGTAFLPDIWTDLGVATKIDILDTTPLAFETHFYIVNGFQDGESDPLGGPNAYPDFSSIPATDNNFDKAFGMRGLLTFFRRWSIGGSFYSGRFTDNGEDGGRIAMLGLDSQFRLSTFWIRMGYIGMRTGLPTPADEFFRGGIYLEASKKLGPRWRLVMRGGTAQNDNRVIDVTDQTLIGGLLIYDLRMFYIAGEYFRDLSSVIGKVNQDYFALRATLQF